MTTGDVGVFIDGNRQQTSDGVLYTAAYYADRQGGALYLFDRNGAELQPMGTVLFPDTVRGVQALDDGAIVATSAGLSVVSTTDLVNPTIVAELPNKP